MYIHTDLFAKQSSKKTGQTCGDAFGVMRDEMATTLVLSDGLGSGVKAHIAANMCVARILELTKLGMSLREVFAVLSKTMDRVWGTGEPFAVFTIARILNTGQATVLSYEMPPPILINKTYAQVRRDRVYSQAKAIVYESNFFIGTGEGLMLLSDGITQAGIGKFFNNGWDVEGVRQFLQTQLPIDAIDGPHFTQIVHDKGRSYWPNDKGDDCSVLLALNRNGIIVNLMSGPPINNSDDEDWVSDFKKSQGIHVVSGGSTSMMVARVLQRRLTINEPESNITPPSYQLDGIELLTEGVITLNQVYHLLDEEPENYPTGSPASEIAQLFKMADRVNIWLGGAENRSEGSIEFKQQGLLNRKKIINKMAQRLLEQGKLVVVSEK